ncbi:MAG: GspH/FimT family pseudopilin [Pseudomonadota bacterium]
MKRHHGFSAAETLVVLAISVILLGMAVPDLLALAKRQQLKAGVTDLLGAINLARSEAIARGQRVELVPLDPAGANWRLGWVVFVDGDGNRRPDAGEDVIARHGALPEGIRIDAVFSSHQQPDYIAYNGAGRSCSATSSAAARWGTLSLLQGRETRRIKINMLGRARVCDPRQDNVGCSGADDP